MNNLLLTPPDIVVCLNGTLPEDSFFRQLLFTPHSIPLAAADGAAQQLYQRGIIPQYAIGDFDSIDMKSVTFWKQQGIQLRHIENQNATDFEKTLDVVAQKGHTKILICGFHGGDLDHTLNNWSIVMRYSRHLHLCIYDNQKVAIPIQTSITWNSKRNDMISLIPQPTATLTTQGLQWNLSHEVLALGTREGARNRALDSFVRIELHEGSLLVFLPAQLPMMPIVSQTLSLKQ